MASVEETMRAHHLRPRHHSMHDLVETMLADGAASHAQTIRLLIANSDRVNESMLIGPGLQWVKEALQ